MFINKSHIKIKINFMYVAIVGHLSIKATQKIKINFMYVALKGYLLNKSHKKNYAILMECGISE